MNMVLIQEAVDKAKDTGTGLFGLHPAIWGVIGVAMILGVVSVMLCQMAELHNYRG